MRNVGVRVVSVGLLWAASGCFFDAAVPDGVKIACDSDDDCPVGMLCAAASNLCVGSVEDLGDPPVLDEANVSPRYLRAGSELRVEVTLLTKADEVEVYVDAAGERLSLAADPESDDPLRLSFSRVIDEEAPEGTYAVRIDASNAAGKLAGFRLGDVTFDFTPPSVVTELSVVNPTALRAGAAIVRVVASEALSATPTLLIDGEPLEEAPSSEGGGVVTWSIAATALGEGVSSFAVADLVDLAGNEASGETPLGTVTVDTSPPEILAVNVEVGPYGPTPGYADVNITASFGEAPAEVVAFFGQRTFTCTEANGAGTELACDISVSVNDPEGSVPVIVTAADAVGNQSTAQRIVFVDVTAPVVVPDSITTVLEPPSGTEVAAISALRQGAVARVAFATSEPLAAVPSVRLLAADAIDLTVATLAPASFLATFAMDASGPLDGSYELEATLRDAAGNERTELLSGVTLTVDTTPPAAPSTEVPEAVVYRRAPWGSDASAGLAEAVVVGAAGAAEGAFVIARILPEPTAPELGRASVAADGSFSLPVVRVDVPRVWLFAVDNAGNVSPPAGTRDSEWVATLGQKQPGNTTLNPHRALAMPTFTKSLRGVQTPYTGVVELGGARLGRSDSLAETVAPAPEWVSLHALQMPVHREYFTLAYDSWRGQSVLHGGSNYDQGEVFLEDTWVWDGVRWAQRPVLNPGVQRPGVAGAGMAFDPVRGVTVLFGGINNSGSSTSHTWEFDGIQWRRIVPLDPEGDGNPSPVSYGIAMAFDHVSQRVVMRADVVFGDDDGWVWFWDGTSWEGFDPAIDEDGDGEPPDAWRTGPTYDPVNHRLLHLSYFLVGSPVVTYEWTGRSWRVVDVPDPEGDGDPTSLVAHAMSIARQEIVAIDQRGSNPITIWRFDGTSWAMLPTVGGPDPAFTAYVDPGFVYDESRDVYVLVTGYDEQETWELDGLTWRRRISTEDPVPPSDITDGPLGFGYDPVRNVIVRFGSEGYSKWVERAWYPFDDVTAPPAVQSIAWPWLAHPDSGRIMELTEVGMRVLDESAWTVTPYANQGPFAASYAYFRLVFEGDGVSEARLARGDGTRVEVWQLDESVWTLLSDDPADGVTAPRNHDVAWDPVSSELIAVDVSPDQTTLQTWSWRQGSGWTRVVTQDAEGDGEPFPRNYASLFFHPERGAVVLYGGSGAYQTAYYETYDDLWTFRGDSWERLVPIDARLDGDPSPREWVDVTRHPELAGLFIHGGWNSDDYSVALESWRLEDASDAVPAALVELDLEAAGREGATFESADLRVVASSSLLYDPSSPVTPSVDVWDRGAWERVTDASAASGELTELSAALSERRVSGQKLLLAVHPGALEREDEQSIALDYAELTLRYRFPD